MKKAGSHSSPSVGMRRGLDAGRSEFSKGDHLHCCTLYSFVFGVSGALVLTSLGHYGPHFFDTTKCLCSLLNAIAIPSTSSKPGKGELEELPALPLPQMTSITF